MTCDELLPKFDNLDAVLCLLLLDGHTEGLPVLQLLLNVPATLILFFIHLHELCDL
jgi:hypothetical protein